jgi:threonine/homoserine/homoserine lactone efflux protein
MDLIALAGFALTSLLIELTPGPNMAYLAVVAATQGRREGYAAVAGVALGLAVVGFAAALGLAAAINASPALFQALRWAGVGYLLWLAWDGWRDAADPVDHAPPGSSVALYFRRGLVTNLLNPKAAVFYVAVLPTFVDPGGAVMAQTVTLSLVFVGVATVIHGGIVTLAGAARVVLLNDRRRVLVRRELAVALALIAVWFAWKTRG